MARVDDRWRDRVRGVLLGLACGDALGAPFEGARSVADREIEAWAGADAALRATDDTVQALVIAEHLAAQHGQVIQDLLAGELARAWKSDPGRGYGPATVRVFEAVLAGAPWPQASGSLFDGAGSLGDGAAMRVAPVGVLGGPYEHLARMAHRSAAVTHAHPLGKDGAVVQACAVALAAESTPGEPIDRDSWCATLSAVAGAPLYRTALNRVREFIPHTAPGEVAASVGHGVRAPEAVPAALAAFLAHPDQPGAAIRYAIAIGGDTDTIAAMTGALAGARCGAAALPPQWLNRLEHADELLRAAGNLCPLRSGQGVRRGR